MSLDIKGELVPIGGGDNIPLIRDKMTIGRRESCDICLRFPNISGLHAEMAFVEGCWFIRDMGSTNGVKINGNRVEERLLRPGDEISIASRRYTIDYNMPEGRVFLERTAQEDIMSTPLLEKAGLVRPRRQTNNTPPGKSGKPAPKPIRFDPDDEED
jgi:adenylate cyclase